MAGDRAKDPLPPMPFAESPIPAELLVEEGQNPGLTVPVGRECIVGRDVSCDLAVFDPALSRRQFRIARDDSGFVLHDLDSANGTFVNGKRAEAVRLFHRDAISCGGVRLRFLCSGCPNPGKTRIAMVGVAKTKSQRLRLPGATGQVEVDPLAPIPAPADGSRAADLAVRTLNLLGAITATTKSTDVFAALLQGLDSLLPWERIVLCRYHEPTRNLVPMLHRLAAADKPGGKVELDLELVLRCCESGRAIACAGPGGLRMAVPLHGRRRVVGAMVLDVGAGVDTTGVLPLLGAVGRHAGFVLEDGETAARVRQQQIELEAAHRDSVALAEALGLEQAQLRAVVEGYDTGVLLLDDRGHVLLTNRTGAPYLARACVTNAEGAVATLAGRPLADWMAQFDAEGKPIAREIVLSGVPAVVDLAIARVALAGATDPHGPDRPGPGSLIVFRDASERKRMEESLREQEARLLHAQKMEAVGRLAGGIAHDFNNLLTVILGYAELQLVDPRLEPKQRNAVEQIRRAADRGASLTRQLLAFSRRQVIQPKLIELNTLVAEMEQMLRRLIGERILLTTVFAPDLGRILADPGQMEQVILNLVVNARDAMPGGGKITIRTENLVVDEGWFQRGAARRASVMGSNQGPQRAGPTLMLSVTDTGTGMDQATRQMIFEPFFTTKEQGKGTGLGLSTVYGIVMQNQGDIWVYSEPGQGSTFEIYLPRADAPEPTRPAERVSLASAGGTETLLLAEDDDGVRELLRSHMVLKGYRVLLGRNGVEALAAAHAHGGEIHLLVTDIVMPEMGGDELARRLRQERPGVKVVFISGHTGSKLLNVAELSRMDAFLQKPFLLDDLAAKVRAVLDGSPALPAGPCADGSAGS